MAKKAGKRAAGNRPAKKVVRKKETRRKATPKRALGSTGRKLKFGQRIRHTMLVGLTDEQADLIDKAASLAGLKRAAFLRTASLEHAGRVVGRAAKASDPGR